MEAAAGTSSESGKVHELEQDVTFESHSSSSPRVGSIEVPVDSKFNNDDSSSLTSLGTFLNRRKVLLCVMFSCCALLFATSIAFLVIYATAGDDNNSTAGASEFDHNRISPTNRTTVPPAKTMNETSADDEISNDEARRATQKPSSVMVATKEPQVVSTESPTVTAPTASGAVISIPEANSTDQMPAVVSYDTIAPSLLPVASTVAPSIQHRHRTSWAPAYRRSTVTPSLPPTNPTSIPTLEPSTAPSNPKRKESIVFYATGDVPYSERDAIVLERQMKQLPADADFVVHLGDIRNAKEVPHCAVEDYNTVAGIFKQSHVPVLVVMGDNEWNDCENIDEGYQFWMQTFPTFAVDHWENVPFEMKRLAGRPDAFVFEWHGTLFFGLNLVGGLVHDRREWYERHLAQYRAVTQQIREYVSGEPRNKRVVIFAHADPQEEHGSFFGPMVDFIDQELRNQVPILYLNGDKHEWDYQESFLGQKSLLRVMVTGGVSEAPVRFELSIEGDIPKQASQAFPFERHSYTYPRPPRRNRTLAPQYV